MTRKKGFAHAAKRGTAPQPQASTEDGAKDKAAKIYSAAKWMHQNPTDATEESYALGAMVAIAMIFPDVATVTVWR